MKTGCRNHLPERCEICTNLHLWLVSQPKAKQLSPVWKMQPCIHLCEEVDLGRYLHNFYLFWSHQLKDIERKIQCLTIRDHRTEYVNFKGSSEGWKPSLHMEFSLWLVKDGTLLKGKGKITLFILSNIPSTLIFTSIMDILHFFSVSNRREVMWLEKSINKWRSLSVGIETIKWGPVGDYLKILA